jgi:hypothetical protein
MPIIGGGCAGIFHLHHPSGRDGVNAELPLIYHHKPDARDRGSRALAGRYRKQRIKCRVAFLVAPNDHIGSKSPPNLCAILSAFLEARRLDLAVNQHDPFRRRGSTDSSCAATILLNLRGNKPCEELAVRYHSYG